MTVDIQPGECWMTGRWTYESYQVHYLPASRYYSANNQSNLSHQRFGKQLISSSWANTKSALHLDSITDLGDISHKELPVGFVYPSVWKLSNACMQRLKILSTTASINQLRHGLMQMAWLRSGASLLSDCVPDPKDIKPYTIRINNIAQKNELVYKNPKLTSSLLAAGKWVPSREWHYQRCHLVTCGNI